MRILSALFFCLMLGACGFHLRGAGDPGSLSFTTVSIEGEGAVAQNLRKYLGNYRGIELVSQGAETVIRITDTQYSKDVLSVNNAGRVAEYRLNYRVSFSATHKGEPVLESGTMRLSRTLTWDENSLLSKESEEATLVRDMQNDVVPQVLRRVSALVKKAK